MTANKGKTPAKMPAKKMPAKTKDAKTPVAEKPKEESAQVGMVKPMDKEALRMVLELIGNSDIKAKDSEMVISLKYELMRVSGLKNG